ncbi:MAG: acetolactate synthase AlsS [Coxiellaceae bacterium]|nr:acetolactate synthase AlsS [Coxiellaceae bacterium]
MALDPHAGARLLVKCLESHGVEYIFGIPGAKIDAVYDALNDSPIRIILCRHEQNAAFMAASYGRLTGKPGVVLVTSGPGVANLCTGLLTATTEGDPVVAIGGNVSRAMALKASHQSMNNVLLMKAVCKYDVEVKTVESIPEIVENAFRLALEPQSGAAFISLPQDVSLESTKHTPFNVSQPVVFGSAPMGALQQAVELIDKAKCPIILLGQEASREQNTQAVRDLLLTMPMATIGTYQAAGVISHELLDCFFGRVGLFQNQPGDVLLEDADVVLTIGFNPAEYDPEIWNSEYNKTLIHLDYTPAEIRCGYQPRVELLGDIATNVEALRSQLKPRHQIKHVDKIRGLVDELHQEIERGKELTGTPIHPLRFIYDLRKTLTDDDMVICDIGSVYMWMARYYLVYRPRHLLFSNGQQTLGVALPWAMGCNFAYPDRRVVSMSGDGGFLFSAMELETAVREGCRFVHIVWADGSYDMVKEQQVMKYKRDSAVHFNDINIVDFAQAFGAKGYSIGHSDELVPTLEEALQQKVPVLINMPVDYSDNPALFEIIDPDCGH